MGKSNSKDAGFLMMYVKMTGEKALIWLKAGSLENCQAVITIPSNIPVGSYIVWPKNTFGYGNPIILNLAETWWAGPRELSQGSTATIFGKNLTNKFADNQRSWIYMKKKGSNDKGKWLSPSATNPYKVEFKIPENMNLGEYDFWVHNGYLGNLGWSNKLTILISNNGNVNGITLNVKDAGAKGDGNTDDWPAINKCIIKAATSPNSTVFFPEGDYKVSRGFNAPSNVRWIGEARKKVNIILGTGFTYNAQDASQYTLIFNNEGHLRCENVLFRNIDFGVERGAKGTMNALIYIRGSKNLSFDHCSVTGAPGFARMDLAFSQGVTFKNCTLTLGGLFFATAKQVFIDSTLYNGILDCNIMLEFWGCDGVSITNCTAKDLDNSPQGQSAGRFISGNTVWSSNLNMYAANNTTIRLAPRKSQQVDQNSGEQFLWEGANIAYKGKAVSFSYNKINLPTQIAVPEQVLKDNAFGVFIINGKGVGQHRLIKRSNKNAIELNASWDIIPDKSSIFLITTFNSNCVVYKNTIQGKSERIDDEIASSGVQLYTNCINFVVDGNFIRDVKAGLSTWSHIGGSKQGMENNDFCYFNEFKNNICQNIMIGVGIYSANWHKVSNDGNALYLGNMFRNNQFTNCKEAGIQLYLPIEGRDNVNLSIFEENETTGKAQRVKISSPGINAIDKASNDEQVLRKIRILDKN